MREYIYRLCRMPARSHSAKAREDKNRNYKKIECPICGNKTVLVFE